MLDFLFEKKHYCEHLKERQCLSWQFSWSVLILFVFLAILEEIKSNEDDDDDAQQREGAPAPTQSQGRPKSRLLYLWFFEYSQSIVEIDYKVIGLLAVSFLHSPFYC